MGNQSSKLRAASTSILLALVFFLGEMVVSVKPALADPFAVPPNNQSIRLFGADYGYDFSKPDPVLINRYPNYPWTPDQPTQYTRSVSGIIGASAYFKQTSPTMAELLYTNASNIYLDVLLDWLSFADTKGYPREGAFFHVTTPTKFSASSPSSLPVTGAIAAGSPINGTLSGAPGDAYWWSYEEKYNQLNVTLSSTPSPTWSAQLEYPTATNSNGDPTAWAPLPILTDTTAGLRQSGQITFDPPLDWKPIWVQGIQYTIFSTAGQAPRATTRGIARLYTVRWRNLNTSTATPPVLKSVTGADYYNSPSNCTYGAGMCGTIPVFDYNADTEHKGYLTAAQYATRASGKDAYFEYQGRQQAGYGPRRYGTRPGNPGFVKWVVDSNQRMLAANPYATGLFVDNSGGGQATQCPPVVECNEALTTLQDYAALLSTLRGAVYPDIIVPNTAIYGTFTSDDPIIVASGVADGPGATTGTGANFYEFGLRPYQDGRQGFAGYLAVAQHHEGLTSEKPYDIWDTFPGNASGQGISYADPNLWTSEVSEYLMLAGPHTMLSLHLGDEPLGTPSKHWAPVVAYNFGQPLKNPDGTNVAASIVMQNIDSEPIAALKDSAGNPKVLPILFQVYWRPFEHGINLYLPLGMTYFASGCPFNGYWGGPDGGPGWDIPLPSNGPNGAAWQQVQADGTLGPIVQSAHMTYGFGAFFVPAPGATMPAQLPAPQVAPASGCIPITITPAGATPPVNTGSSGTGSSGSGSSSSGSGSSTGSGSNTSGGNTSSSGGSSSSSNGSPQYPGTPSAAWTESYVERDLAGNGFAFTKNAQGYAQVATSDEQSMIRRTLGITVMVGSSTPASGSGSSSSGSGSSTGAGSGTSGGNTNSSGGSSNSNSSNDSSQYPGTPSGAWTESYVERDLAGNGFAFTKNGQGFAQVDTADEQSRIKRTLGITVMVGSGSSSAGAATGSNASSAGNGSASPQYPGTPSAAWTEDYVERDLTSNGFAFSKNGQGFAQVDSVDEQSKIRKTLGITVMLKN